MHKIIGGYIEVVNMGHDRYVVVDEEGLLKELPYNHMASILVHGIVRGPIVGPALVCTYRELEGEYEDAEDEDNEDEKNT
jgi:hypothetical protein